MLSRNELKARTLSASGLGTLLRKMPTWRGVVALAYHRIGSPGAIAYDRGLFSATPQQFEWQVKYLAEHFDVVTPEQILNLRDGDSGRYLLITFDDGYRDNYATAFEILRSAGVAATFFISTGFIEDPRLPWWDEIAWMIRSSARSGLPASRWLAEPLVFDEPMRERAVCSVLELFKRLQGEETAALLADLAEATGSGRAPRALAADTWMSWDMLREMREAGMCIGGHTVDHPILSRLSPEQQELQIAGCRKHLELKLGQPMRFFSYPRGKLDSFDEHTRRCLRENGVELAFSYYGGFSRFDQWDAFDVRRTAVELDVTNHRFQAITTLPQVFS